MARVTLTPGDFRRLHLLAMHASVNAPHRARFHNVGADFAALFPTPVGHVDQRDDYRSALSPTAYLVDLVRLVSEHIVPPDDDRLALPTRRPDIFTLELSQESAERAVPYLEIANGVMRAQLEQTAQGKLSAPEMLAQRRFPFALPFHRPLTEIRAYLRHCQIELADICAAFGAGTDDEGWVVELLNLVPGELAYLATAAATPAALNDAYGVTAITDTTLGGLDRASVFLAQTGLTPDQLTVLVRIATPGAPLSLRPDEAAAGQWRIDGLDLPNLDYLHRFIRLANRLGWSFADLDVALASSAAPPGGPPALDRAALDQLARIAYLRGKYGLPLDVLCSFWSDLRTAPPIDRPAAAAPFDRVFHAAHFLVMGGAQGITADTITLAADASGATDAYRGLEIAITDGPGAGQVRTVVAYDGATKIATVDRPWRRGRRELPTTQSRYTLSQPCVFGRATGGTADTITLVASAPGANGLYRGLQVAITAGPGAGQTRTITAYDGATKVATVDAPWSPRPDQDSRYVVCGAANLKRLLAALYSALNVNDAAGDALLDHLVLLTGSFALDLRALTKLFGLATQATMFGLPVPHYLALLHAITVPEPLEAEPTYLRAPLIDSVADLLTVAGWADWLRDTGLSPLDLRYLTRAVPDDAAGAAVAAIAAVRALAPRAAAAAVGEYLRQVQDWALTPGALAQQGVDAGLATALLAELAAAGVLDSAGLVNQPAAALTEAAIGPVVERVLEWVASWLLQPHDQAAIPPTPRQRAIQAVCAALQGALARQTTATNAFWGRVCGVDATAIAAPLAFVAGVDERTPLTPALVRSCRGGAAAPGGRPIPFAAGEIVTVAPDPLPARGVITVELDSRQAAAPEGEAVPPPATVPAATADDGDAGTTDGVDLTVTAKLARLLALAKALGLSAQQLPLILRHADSFGAAFWGEGGSIPLGVVRGLADFSQLARSFARQGDLAATATSLGLAIDEPQAIATAALLRYLRADADDSRAALAALSGWGVGQIDLLRRQLRGPLRDLAYEELARLFYPNAREITSRADLIAIGARIWPDFVAAAGVPAIANVARAGQWRILAGELTGMLGFPLGEGRTDADWQARGRLIATRFSRLFGREAAVDMGEGGSLRELARMRRCCDLAARLGVDSQLLIDLRALHAAAEQGVAWAEYAETARACLNVVRAKYRPADWEAAFAPLRDHLNELERDALVALLLHQLRGQFAGGGNPPDRPAFATAQDLYEYLLVDVQMGGCAQTTRVREAIDCLQVYIQRCRLNLEAGATLSAALPDALWDWMGHYRLWQANRKLFFYPENYLDPTLRTREATPEFLALQRALLQGAVTKDAVEQAAIGYLEQLDNLAHLTIVNGCYALVPNPNSGVPEATLFLIGRTATLPPVYYQRRARLTVADGLLDGGIASWAPWQKIDASIPADRVCPLYLDDRLHLFWIEQQTRTDPADRATPPAKRTFATIKFSYQQLSGTWVQPQGLPDEVDLATVTAAPRAIGFPPGNSLTLTRLAGSAATASAFALSQDRPTWGGTVERFLGLGQRGGGLAVPVEPGPGWQALAGAPAGVAQLVASGGRLFASTVAGGLYLSADTGTTWAPVGGVTTGIARVATSGGRTFIGTNAGLLASTDGGATWAYAFVALGGVGHVVAGGAALFALPVAADPLRSADGGATWAPAGRPPGTLAHLLAVGARFFAATSAGLFASADGGASWGPIDGVAGSVNTLAAADAYLYAGTTDGLLRSADNGATWAWAFTVPGGVRHLLVSGGRLFAAAGAVGLSVSDDQGANWRFVGVTGRIAAIVGDGTRVYVGNEVGLLKSADNGATWAWAFTVVGGVRHLLLHGEQVLAASGNLGLSRSSDHGATWHFVGASGPVAHLVAAGDRLYSASGDRVQMSADQGATWGPADLTPPIRRIVAGDTALCLGTDAGLLGSTDQGTLWLPVAGATGRVAQLLANGPALYAQTAAGQFASADAGATWQPIGGVAGAITRLLVSGDRLFLATDAGLFARARGGGTWARVVVGSGGVAQLAANGGALFASTATGLYRSADNGATWTLATPFVSDLLVTIGDRNFTANGDMIFFGTADFNNVAMKGIGAVTQIVTSGDRLVVGTTDGLFVELRDLSDDDRRQFFNELVATESIFWGKSNSLAGGILQLVASGRWVVARTAAGLFMSADNGLTWLPADGVAGQVAALSAIAGHLFAIAGRDAAGHTLYRKNLASFAIVEADGATWLALPHARTAGAPTYRVARLTTTALRQLRGTLLWGGFDALFSRASQALPEPHFAAPPPPGRVEPPFPPDTLSFDLDSAHAGYFRELFFHLPHLLGATLQAHQQFAEAKRWYEYIFDPLAPPDPEVWPPAARFWNYLPLRRVVAQDLVAAIAQQRQFRVYEDDPFDPFAIAELRPDAYQKALAMRYLDNLLAWADALYALDGWENLNAATTLYVLAAELLGPRPQPGLVGARNLGQGAREAGRVVHQPRPDLAEAIAPRAGGGDALANPFFDVPAVFVLPENDLFAGYWTTVAQRLDQLRHCLNLQGVARQVPLFDPELDPRQVLRAVATGRTLDASGAGPAVAVPHYRFVHVLERARQMAGELKQLGGALLGALEKQDAEQLTLLRNAHAGSILALTTTLRQQQQAEHQHTLVGLQQSLASAQARYARNRDWAVGYLSAGERAGLRLTQSATAKKELASLITTLSGIAYVFPNIFGLADGGMNYGKAVEVAAGALGFEASILEWAGQLALTKAQYDRRQAEWQLQADVADYEVRQITAQIDALGVRRAMADQELAIHQQSIAQNQELDQYYRQKFTGQERYQWLVGELGALYFQTYRVALDLARMAERAFQYERNTADTYLTVGEWDSLHRGLLAGETLALGLNQLEQAYIEQNARPLEIEKTISLGQIDPLALLNLKRTGVCDFALGEALFDLDFPGHYRRTIKTISLSIPAVVGPYQNLHATLIQRSNQVVLAPDLATVKFLLAEATDRPPDDRTLRSNWQANQQIALSRGANDAGLFELNFNDERYLPFEGTGAVSRWTLRLPKASNRFDFDSISDVIITLHYTACDGGEAFRQELLQHTDALKGLSGYRLFTVRQLNAAGWQALRAGTQETLAFSLDPGFFPHNLGAIGFDSGSGGTIAPIAIYGWPSQAVGGAPFALRLPPGQPTALTGRVAADNTGWEFAPTAANTPLGTWQLQFASGASAATALQAIDDLLLIVPFRGALDWDG